MVVYDKAYNELKIKYLVPLTKYSVPYNKLENMNVKMQLLGAKFNNVIKNEDGSFLFIFENQELMKALLGDIELFLIRQIMQKKDSEMGINNKYISTNWNIVTHYYHAFFCGSLLLRLTHRGNTFLDNEYRKTLDKVISEIIGERVQLDSNQFYEVVNFDEQIGLKLTKSSGQSHEIVWQKMDELLDEMIMLTRNNSDESKVLKGLKQMNNVYSNTFPSKLRNRVNYQPYYGVLGIENNFHKVDNNLNWIEYILRTEYEKDDDSIINAMYAYSKYIEVLCRNLVGEYYDMRGHENGVIKALSNKNLIYNSVFKPQYSFEVR